MAYKKRQPTAVRQTTEPGQRSPAGGDLYNYLYRIMPLWGNPSWQESSRWRNFIQLQPVAVAFRDTLISYIQNLDWAIVPRDSTQQDELKEEIKYYTRLFENTSSYYGEYDFTTHIEFIGKDLLDLPFGSASEFGRENNEPDGRVVWIRPLDGGTLAPTLNKDWPVVQQVMGAENLDPIFFPKEQISRIFMSPRTEIRREGWGMAPPEKIYLAMELLVRGDRYYADLLLNTPEVGILDLGDMEKSSAEEWIKSFQDLLYGVNAFKIPVTYEHNNETKWIPFGKLPNDLMFDNITRKYAAIVGAGYGMTLSDIGLGSSTTNGGETLAGTIRGERHTNGSGKAVLKKKFVVYFNRFLPEALKFQWIDYDAETQVAQGRARLANAQASEILVRNQVFAPDEMRMQAIRDGLVTIQVPEKLNRKGIEWPLSGGSLGSGLLGKPQAPSSGGHGEVLSTNKTVIRSELGKALAKVYAPMRTLVRKAKVGLSASDLAKWSDAVDQTLFLQGTTHKAVLDNALRRLSEGVVSPNLAPASTDLTEVSDYVLDRFYARAEERAQGDFVLEKRAELSLSESECLDIERRSQQVDIQHLSTAVIDHSGQVWCGLVAKTGLKLLKEELLRLDFENGVGDNKLEVVKSVSERLAEALPEIEEVVQSESVQFMNDQIEKEEGYVTGN